jgi:GDPmannose 4,6-dehydratase
MPIALITGCTGQDGSYLAEFLLDRGYEVHGLKRRSSSFNSERLDHIYQDLHEAGTHFFLHYADLTDASSLATLLYDIRPDEIYNLGAQSHVKVSFEIPEFTADVVATGTLRLLEATRRTGVKCRFYQASSSEMFGSAPPPQNESTPFHPRSPYACAKVFGHNITVNYRESYGLHASSGILFNHESPRRGETFVTRKITRAVAHIKHGLQHKLYLGNLEARRDWGYAPDYVRAMWLMLQQDKADDYVIGTGEAHTIREFAELAFAHAGLDWREYVEIDPRYFRPAEVDHLCADPTTARRELAWEPVVTFDQLVRLMVDADVQQVESRLKGGAEPLRKAVAAEGRNT